MAEGLSHSRKWLAMRRDSAVRFDTDEVPLNRLATHLEAQLKCEDTPGDGIYGRFEFRPVANRQQPEGTGASNRAADEFGEVP
jgi:hypothetical protein